MEVKKLYLKTRSFRVSNMRTTGRKEKKFQDMTHGTKSFRGNSSEEGLPSVWSYYSGRSLPGGWKKCVKRLLSSLFL
jgi:hypothetical protein